MLESLLGGVLRGTYLLPIVVGCLLAARHGSYLPLWQPQAGLVAAYVSYYVVEVRHLHAGIGLGLGLSVGTFFGVAVHRLFFQPSVERASPFSALLYGLAITPMISSVFGLLTSGYPVTFERSRGSWELFVPWPLGDTLRIPDLVAVVSAIIILVLVHATISRTRLGLEYTAACTNRQLAIDFGLRVHRLDRVVPSAAAFLCSLGGLLYALKFGAHPLAMIPASIKAVAIVVALGTSGGVVTAGLTVIALSMAEAAVQSIPAISAFENALAYCVLIVALMAQFALGPRLSRWKGLWQLPATTR